MKLLLFFTALLSGGIALVSGLAHSGSGTSVKPSSDTPAQQYVIHRAGTRGETNAGWLQSRHTFSFNDYFEPDRMNFGALRVLNDDRVNGGYGFPLHAHTNMEIISIPLAGAIDHRDNMGNAGTIQAGDVQIMSAGSGIRHSEQNHSRTDTLRFLQIWVLANRQNVSPRYQQINAILSAQTRNTFKKFMDPNDTHALFIHQEAIFSMGLFDRGRNVAYKVSADNHGVYAFILDGSAVINGIPVGRRDGIGLWNAATLKIEATTNLRVLLMDVPMLSL